MANASETTRIVGVFDDYDSANKAAQVEEEPVVSKRLVLPSGK